MRAIDILDQRDLEASGTALAGDDGGIGEEVLPDTVPPDTILGLDLVLVGEPIAVPSPQSGRVVDADSIDALDLEAGAFKRVDNEAQGSRGIGAGEDIFVHEQTPLQILVLPEFAKAGDLQEECAVIVEHIVDLAEER